MSKNIFWAGITVFIGLYFIFYPPIYSFRDEASYFSMAWLAKQGGFFIDQAGVPFQSWVVLNGRKIFDYPLGMPFLLVPLISVKWQAAFLAGLLAHLAGAVYFHKILKLLKINPAFFLIYLFYPAFTLYSRTLMSDVPSTAFFLIGVYHYLKSGGDWKAGAGFGLGLLIRPSGFIFVLPFALVGIFRRRLGFLAALACFLLALGASNQVLYGDFLATAYSQKFSMFHDFSLKYFAGNLAHYLVSFAVVLVSAIFASKSRRPEFLAAIFLGLIFFSCYFFYDRFPAGLQTRVFGTRFLFPALALGFLMCAEAMERLKPFLAATLIFLLLASSAAVHWKHQEYLKAEAASKDEVYSETPENSVIFYDANSAPLLQEAWGKRDYYFWRDGEKDLREFLNGADFTRGVFLIKRDGLPGVPSLSWVAPADMEVLQKDFSIRLKTQKGELEIYQIHGRI